MKTKKNYIDMFILNYMRLNSSVSKKFMLLYMYIIIIQFFNIYLFIFG